MSEHEIQRELIDALLDGELEGEEKARAERHLDECTECRAYVGKAKRLSNALAALPKHGAPPVLVDRIKRQAGMGRRAFWLSRTFVSVFSAAAAVIVVVAVTLTQYGRDEDLALRSAPAATAPKEEGPAADAERVDALTPAAGEDRMRHLRIEKRGWDKDAATLEEAPAESLEAGEFGKAARSFAADEARPARKGWTAPATPSATTAAPKPAAEPQARVPQQAVPDTSAITGLRQEVPADAGLANQAVRMKRPEAAFRPSLEAAQPPSPVRAPSPEGQAPGLALRDAEVAEAAGPEEPPRTLAGRRRSIAKGIGGSGRGAGFGRERKAVEEKLDEAEGKYTLAEREISRAEKAKAAAASTTKLEATALPEKKAAPRFRILRRLTAASLGEGIGLAEMEARKLGYVVVVIEEREKGRWLLHLGPLHEAEKEETVPAEPAVEAVLADAAVQRRTRSGARRETRMTAEMVQAEAESNELARAAQTGPETLAAVTEGQRAEATQPLQQATVVVDLIPVIEVVITPQTQRAVPAAETETDAGAEQAAPAEKNE